MLKNTSIKLILVLFLSFIFVNAHATSEKSNFYISPKLILAHSSLSGGKVSGSFQEPLVLYTDQNHSKDDNSTSDIVGGAVLSLGYDSDQWRSELSYSYRYRFDLNGDVGEPVPGEFVNHNNLPGRFRLDINTQSVRFDLNYKLLFLSTENIKPFVGGSVESLQHNIVAKVRNAYVYTEEKTSSRSTTFGVGVGAEILWKKDVNFTLSLHYIDLGDIKIGPQSDNAYFSAKHFNTVDIMFGVNYYF